MFKVPANASVRFYIKDIENLKQWPDGLEVRVSQGSSLFQSVQPDPILQSHDFNSDQGGLFELPPPTLGEVWMVWILFRPEALHESRYYSWAAFFSKNERTPELELKTAATVAGNVEKRAVLMDTASGHIAAWSLLKPGMDYQIRTPHGSSIDLITRFPMPPSDGKSQFFYTIESTWKPDREPAPENPLQIWNLETRSDSQHAFKYPPFTAPWIQSKGMVLMGRERVVPLIPKQSLTQGTWTITSDQAVWVRALVNKDPGYLFEEQNAPRPGRKAISEFSESNGNDGSSFEHSLPLPIQSADELFNELTHIDNSPLANWRKWNLIHRLINDPSRKDGGLIAAALAESWARSEPELLSWTHQAIDLQSQSVFFRSLPPSSPSMASTLQARELGYFIKKYIATGDTWNWDYETPTPSAAESVPKGIFSEVSESNPEIHYHWKSIQAPRRLRLALGSGLAPTKNDALKNAKWPMEQTIEFIVTSFPSGTKQSLYWSPGLAVQLKAEPVFSADQQLNFRRISDSGASSWFQPVLNNSHQPWIQVETLEWKIPTGDSHASLQLVKSQRSDDLVFNGQIHVMMSVQDTRSPRLGETDTQAKAGSDAWQIFWKEFRKFSIREGLIDTPATALIKDWIPIFRRLNSLNAQFHAGIRPKSGTSDSNQEKLSLREYQELIQIAIDHEANGNWMEALESWSQCRMAEFEDLAESTWEGTLRCLKELDEPLLRDRILKGLCAYPPTNVSPEWIQELQDKAINEALEKGDEDDVTLWLARRWIKEPDLKNTQDWIGWLIRHSHAEEALKISKLTPPEWSWGESIIEAAFEAQWLSTLNESLSFQSESVRKFWLGIQSCYEQDWNRALHLWNDLNDDRTKKWKQFISESLELKQEWETIQRERWLENRSAEEISESDLKWLSDWRQWTSTYPGPMRKGSELDGWIQVTGLGYLYSAGRDLMTSVALISPGSPARYQINSGNHLYVRIRPLAENSEERSKPVQLTIRYASGSSEIILVPDSPVSTGLRYIGPGEGLPASETLTTLHIPEKSKNESGSMVEFEVQGGILLIQVESDMPIYDVAAIPLLQRNTFEAWKSHRLKDSFMHQQGSNVSNQAVSSRWKRVAYKNPLQEKEKEREREPQKSFNNVSDSQAEKTFTRKEPEIFSAESEAISHAHDWTIWKQRASQVLLSSNPDEFIAEEALLKQFEIQSRQQGYEDPDFSKTLNEIGRHLTWERIRQVESSSGIHRSAALGIQPTAPAMRIRQALFESPRSRGGIMLRKDAIHWARAGDLDLAGAEWNIQLRMLLVYYWLTDPVEVLVHNSQGAVIQRIQLNSTLSEQRLEIPCGEDTSQIGFSIPSRKTQQFIEVIASIKKPSPEDSAISEMIPVIPEISDKTFHVASAESPIRHRFRAPSWIRVDHLSGSNLITESLFVTDPDGRLELYPKPGESQSYYRLYERTFHQNNTPGAGVSDSEQSESEAPEESKNESPEAQIPPIPAWGHLSDDVLPDSKMREDSLLRPGRQEDGSWEIHGRGYQRRNIEESTSERFAERFLQFSAERRWHAEHWRSYFRASALHRFREHGGATLGVGADWNWNPSLWGGSLTLGGDLYQQKPGGARWNPHDSEESEWAGRLELTAARRYGIGEQWSLTPSITGWMRGLSLKHSGAFSADEIDRDIYTPYKQDHQHGVQLGGTLRWDPTLDQQIWTRLSISSNEDWNLFNPDNYSGQIGWRAIRGSMEAELRYRNVYFQADEDRIQNTWRHFIESRVSWSRWVDSSHRWKSQIMLSYDVMASEWTGWLGLSYLWSEGRRLKDYRPSETWFENIWENRLRE